MPEDPDRPRLVVVTGAAGAIGSLVVERLGARWRIRATDVRGGDGIERFDVGDVERCRMAFEGADAIVHLAADPRPDAGWEALREPNVEGAYAVAAAARACGVRRLVLASSLQAVSGYADARQRRANDPPRPANLYGATKAWAEALGGWVAATSATSVVALRIGYFSAHPPASDAPSPHDRSAWLSPRDCVRAVQAAVEADLSGLTVVNAISANRYRVAELGESALSIGYEPTDDAWSDSSAA